MTQVYNRMRLVVVQAEDAVYFDKYYEDALTAFDKFNYFCGLARINYDDEPQFVFDRAPLYKEMSVYFPGNVDNEKNQSGFVQVSLYFEVGLDGGVTFG